MFTIGADPEIFVGKAGKFVSAHDMVRGDKINPFPVEDGAVQVDGMALEFNIDPAISEEDFIRKIDKVMSQLKGMIGDYDFLHGCSVFFTKDDVVGVPVKNFELGCSADYNAYTLSENPVPNSSLNMRTAGGHIHIGGFESDKIYRPEHFKLSAGLARAMDKYVGIYSLLWDMDDRRRELYGKAGAFRPKKYGMEYRTMSNAWIFSKDLVSFVYKQTQKAVESYVDGERVDEGIYQDIINSSDRSHPLLKTKESNMVREMMYG